MTAGATTTAVTAIAIAAGAFLASCELHDTSPDLLGLSADSSGMPLLLIGRCGTPTTVTDVWVTDQAVSVLAEAEIEEKAVWALHASVAQETPQVEVGQAVTGFDEVGTFSEGAVASGLVAVRFADGALDAMYLRLWTTVSGDEVVIASGAVMSQSDFRACSL